MEEIITQEDFQDSLNSVLKHYKYLQDENNKLKELILNDMKDVKKYVCDINELLETLKKEINLVKLDLSLNNIKKKKNNCKLS